MKGIRRTFSPGCNIHYAQTGEDIVLQNLVEKYIGGKTFTYVDVGCHDPRRISSTYLHYLRGSCGLAIDMNETFAKSFKRERPKDVFVCAAVSAFSGEAYIHEFSAPEVNTLNEEQAKEWRKYWQPKGMHLVKTYPLEELVNSYLPGREIDVLLLDVEGHELSVLEGAGLPRLKPKIIVCEIHGLDLMEVTSNPVANYILDNGYLIDAYATMNAYFIRRSIAHPN